MPNIIHKWKRFWIPRGGSINLTQAGYPYDPESSISLNSDLISSDQISHHRCLILLGEPGIGKSTVIKELSVQMNHDLTTTLFYNLSEWQTIKEIFNEPELTEWKNGNDLLHLFLDSLDEGRLTIKNICEILKKELRELPKDRLYLRIACRTADWPQSLEDCFLELWGKDNIHAYELAPLRRKDVEIAARDNGLDPGSFLRELDAKETGPLASRPITLRFLLDAYNNSAALPSSKAEIYKGGCRLMCQEISPSRCEAGFIGNLDPDHRMIIAGRIAMVSIFANRDSICTSPDFTNVKSSDPDLTLQELIGGSETINKIAIDINESSLREALATALFSSRGANHLGFAHRTYAEFLAAWYIVQKDLKPSLMLKLISSSSEDEGKIIPQLHETAAWLATLRNELFGLIMEKDPKVLLKSDVATAGATQRQALVDKILELYDQQKAVREWDESSSYYKLNFPGLAGILRPYLLSPDKDWPVKYVAIDIAEACGLRELQENLLQIILDQFEPIHNRENAAHALVKIGDEATQLKLKPLAVGDHPDDENDELKACALKALWPDQLSASELFRILSAPRRHNYTGAYSHFVSYELPATLKSHDLIKALQWVRSNSFTYDQMGSLVYLRDQILVKALENLFEENVLDLFCEVVLKKPCDNEKLFDHISDDKQREHLEQLKSDPEKRRTIIEKLVMLIDDPPQNMIDVVWNDCVKASPNDIPWILEKLMASCSAPIQLRWAWLVRNLLRYSSQINDAAVVYDALLIAREKSALLKEIVAPFCDPIDLDSELAQHLREQDRKSKELQRPSFNELDIQSEIKQDIIILLGEFESGDLSAWWKLNRLMTVSPDKGMYYGNEYAADLTSQPQWKKADDSTGLRILNAARVYLERMQFDINDKLPESGIFSYPHAAGYRALRLMLKEDPAFVDSFSSEMWKRWAAIIIWYPFDMNEDQIVFRQEIISRLYSVDPNEATAYLSKVIDNNNSKHRSAYNFACLKTCLDKKLCSFLLEKAKQTSISADNKFHILDFLAAQGYREAIDCAKSMIPDPIPRCGPSYAIIKAAANVIKSNLTNEDWPIILNILYKNCNLGIELLTGGGQFTDRIQLSSLDENNLADLYIWMESVFPHFEDPPGARYGRVGQRERRDDIIMHLRDRGTREACRALEKIRNTFPELDWLKWTIIEAKSNALSKSWIPFSPGDLIELINNSSRRLVQTGEDLLDIVIESLHKMEEKLHGETPAAKFLWNEIKQDQDKVTFRPKDENDLSDWIKNHFDEDLRKRQIIINREVEIRRGKGEVKGQRTDIHIDAKVNRSRTEEIYEKLTLIIEVKGCWNENLMADMENQLANRYIAENSYCNHGLYVVAWFHCDQWDEGDYRKKANSILKDREQAQKQLDQQAADLSKEGKLIRAMIIDTSFR